MQSPRMVCGTRRAGVWLLALAAGAALGCGAREGLLSADGGGAAGDASGGDGPASSSSAAPGVGGAGASGGGPIGGAGGRTPIECTALQVAEPLFVLPDVFGAATQPDVALAANDSGVVIAWSEGGPGGILRSAELPAFAGWPPTPSMRAGGTPAGSFVLGAGPLGPVAWLYDASIGMMGLLRDLSGKPEPIDVTSGAPLFVAGLGDGLDGERYLFASRNELPSYETLGVGSYQPNLGPHDESPFACLDSTVLGAGIMSAGGFLGAYAMTDPAFSDCPVGGEPGASVGVYRYDAPADPLVELQVSSGERLLPVPGDPLVHLAMVRTSFGAWLVYQNAGSNAESPPPPMGLRIDTKGNAVVPGDLGAPVGPASISPWLGVAALGDSVAVAWIEARPVGAPVIAVNIMSPEGQYAQPVTIDTSVLPQTGRMRMVGSRDGRYLLLVWEGTTDAPRVAAARIDCIAVATP